MYYHSDTVVFLDGNWIKAKDAQVSLFDQTMHYGTGVLEGIRSYRTESNYKIFKGREHFQRLLKSADLMHMKVAFAEEELNQIASELLKRNNLTDAYIRPLVFAGEDMMLRPTGNSHLFMAAWKWKKYNGTNPLDVAGAGDAFLATASLAIFTGANIWEACYLGSTMAGVQVSRMGNIPINRGVLLDKISRM